MEVCGQCYFGAHRTFEGQERCWRRNECEAAAVEQKWPQRPTWEGPLLLDQQALEQEG